MHAFKLEKLWFYCFSLVPWTFSKQFSTVYDLTFGLFLAASQVVMNVRIITANTLGRYMQI